MTLPGRRLTPALLQVDAVLDRLSGPAALDEIARFLLAEFSSLGSVQFYEGEAPPRYRGGSPLAGRSDEEVPPAVAAAFRSRTAARDPATREWAVGSREPARWALLAAPGEGELDAGDARFLLDVVDRVARRPGTLPVVP